MSESVSEFKVKHGPAFRNAISSVDLREIKRDLREMGYNTSEILEKRGLYSAMPIIIPTTNSCIEIYGEHINFCACEEHVCSDVKYRSVKDSLTDSEEYLVRYLKRKFRLPHPIDTDALFLAFIIGGAVTAATLGSLGYG